MCLRPVQKVALVIYLFLLAYATTWVPFVIPSRYSPSYGHSPQKFVGYTFIWSSPHPAAAPDIRRIALRVIALTAASSAAFVLAGLSGKKPARG